MKSTHTQPRLERSLDSGWLVHVYNGRRQLLYSLGPSHGWCLAAGATVGVLLAAVGYNLSAFQVSNSVIEEPLPMTAPFQVD